jgi:hypothetical protein
MARNLDDNREGEANGKLRFRMIRREGREDQEEGEEEPMSERRRVGGILGSRSMVYDARPYASRRESFDVC